MGEAGIPEKLFYKIGEAAAIAGLRPSVLRFWESEFPLLRPQKSKAGQRLYSRSELELILEIKRLLYTEKLTIVGAKRRIGRRHRAPEPADSAEGIRTLLESVTAELREIRDSL
jgi:DNA-binding transcriptional MerR regulator